MILSNPHVTDAGNAPDTRDHINVIARTSRVSLRRFTLDDAPFALRILNDPGFLQYIGDRGVRKLEDAENYLRNGPIASYAAYGHGLNAVVLNDGNICIGMCGIVRRETLPGPDLGYAFLPEFTRAGFAEEATRAALSHARDALHFSEMFAIVQPDNAASIKLLRKLGFVESDSLQPRSADGLLLLGFGLML